MKVSIFPGWWQVAVAMVILAVSAASIFTSYSIIAVQLQEAFEPSRMVLMLGVTVTVLAAGCLSPLLGTALDRYSIRTLMLLGSGFLVTGFLLLSLSTSMIQVLAIYILFMSTASVLIGPLATSTLLARWFSRRRGLAMGLAASGTAIGGLFIPPLLQIMIDSFEWRVALRVFSGVAFVLTMPLVALFIIDRPSDRNLQPDGDNNPTAVSDEGGHLQLASTAAVLRSANFWLISISLGVLFAGGMGIVSNLIPLVMEKNIDATRGALLLSIFSAAGFAGKLLAAAVVDRIDFRVTFASILTVLALGTFSLLQANSYAMLVVALAMIGVAGGGVLPFWSFIVAHLYGPANVGRVMGLMTFAITLFNLLSPPLFGLIFDKTGSYDYALIGYICLLVFTLLLLTQIRVVQPALDPTPTTN